MQSTLDQEIPMTFDETADIGADYLEHHGTKGQKWYKRRYQYQDGSLTEEGRIHYGVGPARKAGKALGSVKDAIRKTVNPNSADLDEKIAKQNAKNAEKLARMQKRDELRAAKNAIEEKKMQDKLEEARIKEERQKQQEYIDRVNGKKKDIKDMSDRELQEEFLRLQKEKQIRDMQKDLDSSKVDKFIDQYVSSGIGEGVKRGLSNSIDKKLTAIAQENIKKKDDSYESKLRDETNKLKYTVLTGDEKEVSEATKKLQDLTAATGKKKNDDKNNSSNDSKKQNSNQNDSSNDSKKQNSNQNDSKKSKPKNKPKNNPDTSSSKPSYTYDEFKARARENSRNTYESFLEDQRDKTLKGLGIR